MEKLSKYLVVIVLVVFAWKTLAYFVGQRDHAIVYTKNCLEREVTTCLKFEGKLKYTYFSGDYIIINGDKKTIINKDEVAAVEFR
ncbi:MULTISPECIES: hypothetical protein [Acinetobacter]|uniref:hypothetical protein n=1 Tax=Acinetobacter TaxID=469 RepID=UPI00028D5AC7|nr:MULTISPECIES: hypothetical protein [Acinetobacter]EKU3442211.1 hypothetical protein [Acinetobacter baumannii]MDP7849742.1 hypothetical protein [Acinetobacter baumannii]BBL22137.1 hypothetical protein ACRAD_28080 [Acinetobacter radioresistens DSM 6976 = NBRC 102413 = CIP 103788]